MICKKFVDSYSHIEESVADIDKKAIFLYFRNIVRGEGPVYVT